MSRLVLLPVLASACNMPDRGGRIHLPDADHPVTHDLTVLSEDAAAGVDDAVLAYMATHAVPGLALALIAEGEVVMSAGYGWSDLESLTPVDADTPFLLASVSKTFIGIAAMQAADDGILSLDDPIADLVGFSVDNPHVDGEQITLRDLLTHSAGVSDSKVYDRSYAPGDPTIALADFERGYFTEGGEYWRRDNFSKRMPGEEFEYSNVGAGLAALGIEVAAGQPYAEVVSERILDPLGMTGSSFYLSGLSRDPATLYGTTIIGGGWKPYEQYGFPTYPDGLMRSSANDLGRYLAAMLSDDPGVLSAEQVAELLTVDASAGTDEDGQAIVWVRREQGGRTLYGHNGGDFGASAEIWIDTGSGVGIAIAMNADYINADAWYDLFDLEDVLLDLAEAG